ncbi:hypothetical protein LSH36_93g01043 [Paralvinella palmiformis]|uniref:Kinetochore protein NDC80 n=1 Tax=Paralvinella palmiformis TaxID=53620 RepID=A0AAD9K0T8_9ANNE|nr:hypothetical protein LSH36_93g01043 [Paralvinella palmiformis]
MKNIVADFNMRRSSSFDGAGPLRVRNDAEPHSRSRSSVSGPRASFSGSRASFGTGNNPLAMCGKPRVMNTVTGTIKKRRATTSRLYMSEIRQDPRRITERQFKEMAIKNLIKFLAEYGYPNPCSPKLLHCPSAKEFVRIFEFLYGFLEPGFKCTGRIEDQFPNIMKELGYPFSISKAAMSAIGTPHTWPNLLAALDWLREEIQHCATEDTDQMMFPPTTEDDFDGVPLSKILFQYFKNCYMQFLDGADTFEELDANLAKEISKNSAGGDIESLVHENRRLKQELDMLEKQPDPLIAQQDKLACLKMDYEKLSTYHQQLDIHISQKNTTLKSLTDESKAQEAELAVLKADNEKKQQILSTQIFSQADVERINMERRALKDRIECFETENEEIQSLTWEVERNIGKDQEKVSKKLKEYNQKARLLHLIPITEKNAQGINFEMQHSLDETQSNYFKNTLKPALNQLKNQAIDKLNELEETHIHMQTTLDQLLDQISDKDDLIKGLEDKLRDMDDKLNRKKKAQQQDLLSIQQEIESVQNTLKELHTDGGPDVKRLQTELRNVQKRLEQVTAENQQKIKSFHDFMSEVAKQVVDHKMAIQDCVSKMVKDAKQRLELEKQMNPLDMINQLL